MCTCKSEVSAAVLLTCAKFLMFCHLVSEIHSQWTHHKEFLLLFGQWSCWKPRVHLMQIPTRTFWLKWVSYTGVTLNFNECPENTKEEEFVFLSCLFATGYADSHLLFINLCPYCQGRLFRRWYQKTRLKRLIKQEDEVKLQRCVERF